MIHRMAIVRLQDVKDDDELCQISQRLCQAGVHRELTHSPKSILAWITVMQKDMVVYPATN
jgi:hypothetical protein